jgi:glycerol-3-phosphate dehydrogenase
MISKLSDSSRKKPYDLLVVGGGASGSGAALDAASRGLRVACVERGDFASETSSRSTKLIWAGIRYLATSAAGLLSKRLLTNPVETVKDFWGEFQMVVGCHRERRYMLEQQKHLTKWIPIAIPFDSWVVWPPPFGHPLFALFPILCPFVLKFYDSLSKFTCPPSYVMSAKAAKEKFPQLSERNLKFVAVFYEAQHNDARTNIAIALSAAEHGAHIANYVEATSLLKDGKRVNGARVVDKMSGKSFEIMADKVIFAGGPY